MTGKLSPDATATAPVSLQRAKLGHEMGKALRALHRANDAVAYLAAFDSAFNDNGIVGRHLADAERSLRAARQVASEIPVMARWAPS